MTDTEEDKITVISTITVMGEEFKFPDIVLEKDEQLEISYERRS